MCYIYSLELFNYLLSFADILIIQFSSVTQSCLTLCDPMDCSTPGFLVRHQHLELAQTQVHRVSDDILKEINPEYSLEGLMLMLQ